MKKFMFGFILGAIYFGWFAILLTNIMTNNDWKQELIEKGYAEYNQTTGVWQYKEIKK